MVAIQKSAPPLQLLLVNSGSAQATHTVVTERLVNAFIHGS